MRAFVRGPLRETGYVALGALLVAPWAVLIADWLGYW